MRQTVGPGERLRTLWNRLSGFPGGRWLFSRLFAVRVPYSGTIRPIVLELEPGHARVAMRDRRRVRNHLQSIHAIALINLGELSTGLALTCGLPSSVRGILVELSMEYLKKARGTLTADCSCEIPVIREDRVVEITSRIHDPAGEVVAVARALWRVGPLPPPVDAPL
jgi:acyl-coenzyme A thioesterase PaaI-like protein